MPSPDGISLSKLIPKKLQLIEPGPIKLNSSGSPAMTYKAIVVKTELINFAPTFQENGQGELFGNPPSDPLHN